MPNPSLKRSADGRLQAPSLRVCGTFSQSGRRRPAAVARLPCFVKPQKNHTMSLYSHDYHSVNPTAWRVGLPWPISPRVEDPVRLKEFGDAVRSLLWAQEVARDSLNTSFNHISKLTQGEVRYYYIRRKWARQISWWLNVGTWALGTCGVLIPFVQPLVKSAELLPWGYLALAFAGTLVVADRLFLATEGHGRYTTTQLQVEGAFSEFALSWNAKMLAVDRNNT